MTAHCPKSSGHWGRRIYSIITADHGCDPTTPSTDHSREYVPIVCTGPRLGRGVDLGIRDTFADISATILDFFGLPPMAHGTSFYAKIR